jgi:3-oxoacyl-[acyl-carrier protein] reductase
VSEPDLHGKVALVTGGAVGIGKAIALALAGAGADVAISWHSHSSEGAAVVAELERLGGRALGMELDVSSRQQVDQAVQAVVRNLGAIDILVNNAGGLLAREPIAAMTDSHWDRVLSLNLSSAFYCIRATIETMPDFGHVINVSSLAAHTGGGAGSAAYAAAKAGMLGLTRGLAKELGPRGITVNVVAPGLILGTPFHETFTPADAQRAAVVALPLGRAGCPEDVASAVSWLCSSGAGWVTGAVINVNGGQYF